MDDASCCRFCGKSFTLKGNRIRHEKIHLKDKNLPPPGPVGVESSKTSVVCNGCGMTFSSLKQYRDHQNAVHDIPTIKHVYEFTTNQDFQKWKDATEKDIGVNYTTQRGALKSRGVTRQVYFCRRSGVARTVEETQGRSGKRKRCGKSQGSCKMGQFCTSTIEVKKTNDSGHIQVTYYPTHSDHQLDLPDLAHMKLTKSDRNRIAGMIVQGMPFEEILATMRETHGKSRASLLKRIDLRNIVSALKRQHGGLETFKQREVEEENVNMAAELQQVGILELPLDATDLLEQENPECIHEIDEVVDSCGLAKTSNLHTRKESSTKKKNSDIEEACLNCEDVSEKNKMTPIDKSNRSKKRKKPEEHQRDSACVFDCLDAAKGEFVSFIAKTLRNLKDPDAFRRIKIEICEILLDALAGYYSNSALEKQVKNSVLDKSGNKLPLQKEAKNSPLEERSNTSTLEKQAENSTLENKGTDSALEIQTINLGLEEQAKNASLKKRGKNSGLEKQAKNSALKKRGNNSALEKRSNDSFLEKRSKYSSLDKRCKNSVLEKNDNSVSSLEPNDKHFNVTVPSLHNKETATLHSVDKVSDSGTGLSIQQLTGEIPEFDNTKSPEMTKSSSYVCEVMEVSSSSDKDCKVREKTIGISKTPGITENNVLVQDCHGSLNLVPASSVICIDAENKTVCKIIKTGGKFSYIKP